MFASIHRCRWWLQGLARILSPISYSIHVSGFHELLSEHYGHNKAGASGHENILVQTIEVCLHYTAILIGRIT